MSRGLFSVDEEYVFQLVILHTTVQMGPILQNLVAANLYLA